MSDAIVVSLYRFFEEMHGTGNTAEFSALLAWTCLLFFNALTVLIIAIAVIGMPAFLRDFGKYFCVGVGLVIMLSQYFRYQGGARFKDLAERLQRESPAQRTMRRLQSLTYVLMSPAAFVLSLWLLGHMSTDRSGS